MVSAALVLRLSTIVSTATPSPAVMPAPRQTTASSRKNHDLNASIVLSSPLRCWPTAAYVPSLAPPTHRHGVRVSPHPAPAPSGSRRVETVVPGSR